jgi:hypothetical protein
MLDFMYTIHLYSAAIFNNDITKVVLAMLFILGARQIAKIDKR